MGIQEFRQGNRNSFIWTVLPPGKAFFGNTLVSVDTSYR